MTKDMKKKDIKSSDTEEYDDDCQYIFPQRLMSILSDEKNADSICWLPHGKAFIIRDRALFAEKVMPRFFSRKSKYSSFTRKLNRWNFSRVSSGPELGAYYHEFFLRDQPHLAAQMFCKNARSKIAMASSEPDPAAIHKKLSSNLESMTLGKKMKLDPSHVLMNPNVDPAVKLLLDQQLSLVNHLTTQQQQLQQLQLQRQAFMPTDLRSLMGGSSVGLAAPGSWLQQEIMAQKQQQVRMQQLQQLVTVNLQRQQSPPKSPNNPRASAA